MERVNHPPQAAQPQTNSERELADFDVRYVVAYLSARDNRRYVLGGRPDEEERSARASDYLYRPPDGGTTLAIEHVKLMDQSEQMATARSVRACGISVRWLSSEDKRLQAALTALLRKLRKGQLPATDADRRILVARDRIPVSEAALGRLQLSGLFSPTSGVDEAYLVSHRRLWRMW